MQSAKACSAKVPGLVAPANSKFPFIWDWDSRAGRRRSTLTTLHRRSFHPYQSLELTMPGLEFAAGDVDELRDRQEEEALYVTERRADIYPTGGWVVTRPMHLERLSASGYLAERGRPGVRRYVGLRLRSAPSQVLPSVMSFRMTGERNYYHLLTELVGGRLRLAEQFGVPSDTPIVVSEYVAESPVFKQLKQLPLLADRRWLTQSGRELVSGERVYFAKTSPRAVANLDYARRVFGLADSDRSSSNRLFLIRDPAVGRTLANMSEVADVCKRYGFRIIDPAHMELHQQVETFAAAGHVVGTHGAGLTNIIFRKRAPLHVLEIFPQRRGALFYFIIARHFGFAYRAMLGDSTEEYPWSGPFGIDPRVLSAHMETMLTASGD
jgi:hypothetical protein